MTILVTFACPTSVHLDGLSCFYQVCKNKGKNSKILVASILEMAGTIFLFYTCIAFSSRLQLTVNLVLFEFSEHTGVPFFYLGKKCVLLEYQHNVNTYKIKEVFHTNIISVIDTDWKSKMWMILLRLN